MSKTRDKFSTEVLTGHLYEKRYTPVELELVKDENKLKLILHATNSKQEQYVNEWTEKEPVLVEFDLELGTVKFGQQKDLKPLTWVSQSITDHKEQKFPVRIPFKSEVEGLISKGSDKSIEELYEEDREQFLLDAEESDKSNRSITSLARIRELEAEIEALKAEAGKL